MAAWQENSAGKTRLGPLWVAAALTLIAGPGQARPAPWYWWANRASEQRFCAQTAPGQGWFRDSVAFRDSACSIRVQPF